MLASWNGLHEVVEKVLSAGPNVDLQCTVSDVD